MRSFRFNYLDPHKGLITKTVKVRSNRRADATIWLKEWMVQQYHKVLPFVNIP